MSSAMEKRSAPPGTPARQKLLEKLLLGGGSPSAERARIRDKGALVVPAAEESFFSAVAEIAETPEQYSALVKRFPEFVKASMEHAKDGYRGRFLICVAREPRPGLVRDVAVALADLSCNIEVIRTVKVADQGLLLAVASQKRTEEAPTSVLTSAQLAAKLNDQSWSRDSSGVVHVKALLPSVDAPVENLRRYRFHARFSARLGNLRDLTAISAGAGVWLVTLSAWVSDVSGEKCEVDALLDVPNHNVEKLRTELDSRSRELGSDVPTFEGGANYRIEPARSLAASFTQRAVGVSVIGRARPGLVNHALEGLARGMNILGATAVARLDQYTALVLVLDLDSSVSAMDLEERLQMHMDRWDKDHGEWFATEVIARDLDIQRVVGPTEANISVYLRAADDMGIVAAATGAAADLDGNVVRLDGEAKDRVFELSMFVAAPKHVNPTDLHARLEARRPPGGWIDIHIMAYNTPLPGT